MDDQITPPNDLAAKVEKLGEAVEKLAGAVGENVFDGVSRKVLDPLTDAPAPKQKRTDLPPIDDQRQAILKTAGAKKFGFTQDVLGQMPPEAIEELYSQLHPPVPNAAKIGGVSSPPPIPPQTPPGGPGQPPPLPPLAAVGGSGGSDRILAVLEAINRGVWTLNQNAWDHGTAKSGSGGTGTKGTKKKKADPSESWSGALYPLQEAAESTRLGQIDKRFWGRFKPHGKRLWKAYGRPMWDKVRGKRPAGSIEGSGKRPGPRIKTRPAPPRTPGGPKLPVGVPVGAPAAASAGGASAGGAAAGAGGAAAAGSMAIPIVGATIAVTLALVELAKVARETAKEQESRARELASVSAPHAQGMAQLEVQRKLREIESGANTADSGRKFLESMDRFEESTRPFKDLVDIAKNLFAGGFLDAITLTADQLQILVPIVKAMVESNPASRILHERAIREQNDRRAANNGLFGNQIQGAAAEEQRRQQAAAESMARARSIHDGFFR